MMKMINKKKGQIGDETLYWIIGIIIFLIVLGGLYFLLRNLGIKW